VISGVDHQPIAIVVVLTGDAPFVVLEFMSKYDATFGDEWVNDSVNNRPVSELSNRDKVMLQQALAEYAAKVTDCQDLSQTYRIVPDGLQLDDSMSIINYDNIIIRKGIVFKTIKAIKI
jgi:hypothetical protein